MEDHLPLSVSYSFVCVGRGPYFEEIIQRAFNRGKGKKKRKGRKRAEMYLTLVKCTIVTCTTVSVIILGF